MRNIALITILFFIPISLFNYNANDKLNTEDSNRESIESLIKRGDGYFSYSYEAIVCYKKALEIDSTNQEVIFRIAYFYDLQDSVDLAKHYYHKLNTKYLKIQDRWSKIIYPEIDINKIKMNLLYNDSLEILFKKYGKESSITFDYDISASAFPTYNDNDIGIFFYKLFNKRIFITIYGNGEFEARKYEKYYSKVFFEGKLPDSTLSVILNALQNGRILSMKSLFHEEKNSVNHFEGDYLKYLILIPDNLENSWFERIKIETPLISNSVSIMYLVDRIECSYMFGECCNDINLEYMNSIENRTKAKIKLLEELWKYIYCLDLTKYSTE
ncbi:MAG: hypothetical protein RO257_09350 [Candidatus Kapabacteria bacterium]|nr:hypothetical protein [Candidatus Kapabacteria bacterium]